jgi:hypothetical protein
VGWIQQAAHIFAHYDAECSSERDQDAESYDADFKQEVTRLLASRRSAGEISETLGIAENLLYRWKRMATMRTKSKRAEWGYQHWKTRCGKCKALSGKRTF